MNSALVSVIIPVYNAEKYIRESLLSIICQKYGELEILICDDRSTDRSWDILRAFDDPRITLFRNEKNSGYLLTVNFLVSKSSGQFLCFQDADDYSHPDRIAIQLDKLVRAPSLGIVGSNYATINPHGKIVFKKDVETNPGSLKELLEKENPFQKPSIMFRREVYNTVGMYRPEFLRLGNISEDFDWILRTSRHFEVGNVNHECPLYFYRSVPTAMSKNIKSVNQLFGHAIAIELHRERNAGMKDSIERGDFKRIEDLICLLRRPYHLNKSLFHHKLAESLMYSGLHRGAIKQAAMAICKGPLRWTNYRLFQHCIRKTFFG